MRGTTMGMCLSSSDWRILNMIKYARLYPGATALRLRSRPLCNTLLALSLPDPTVTKDSCNT